MKRRLLGYSDVICAAAGDTISFKVSSPDANGYAAELVRLRCADSHPSGPGFKETPLAAPFAGDHSGQDQPIGIGSYVSVADSATLLPERFTLTLLVWPTTPGNREQALIGNWDPQRQAGVGLVLDERGCPCLLLGDGSGAVQRVSTDQPLLERHWYLLAASVDSQDRSITLQQLPQFNYPVGAVGAGRHTQRASLQVAAAAGGNLQMGAWLAAGLPCCVYNGKLEAPTLFAGCPSLDTLPALHDAVPGTDSGALLAAWDFSRAVNSTHVEDITGRHHGRTHNLPTRAVCGARWDGTQHNFTTAPEHYGAIHFHEDDLYDCNWQTSFTYVVPDDLPCGIYAARLRQGDDEDYLPFYVRAPRGRPRARLALLIPMASYCAYANMHSNTEWDFGEQLLNRFTVLDAEGQYLHYHPEVGISTYDSHTDGSGCCYSSRLRPVINMRPHTWAWQFAADTHLTDWLEEKGFAYDLFTDEELHREGPALLAPYTCVMTGTHPEYYSRTMMNAVLDYQRQGGRFMYMGANGFYWKIDYHRDFPGVIEMRRAEDGSRGWLAEPGEYFHAFSGQLGGLWRRNGIAPQAIAGSGFAAQGFDSCTYYERTPDSFDPRAQFIFAGIGADELIGNFGVGGGAAGYEIDRADTRLGTPPHALLVATASNFSVGYHWVKEEYMHAHAAVTGATCPYVRADMMFYETPAGGAVFSTSSIAWSAALAHAGYANNVSRITENVLRRFLDPQPFVL